MKWDSKLKQHRPGIVLLDEIESHFHPLWQRRLLPAAQAALPDVQIVAASHSPFLITSCLGARIHVLEMDSARCEAKLRESIDAPVGDSIATVLRGIFDIPSQFDIDTEKHLREWNELNKLHVIGKISAQGSKRHAKVTETHANRSEELKASARVNRETLVLGRVAIL